MENELQVLEEIVHPNIIKVHELLEDEKNYYMVMEFISGGNLLDLMMKDKPMTETQVAKIVK